MIMKHEVRQDLQHKSVMKQEAVNALVLDSGGRYIDATLGRGGHAFAILNKLKDSGRLLMIDQDSQAIEAVHHDTRFDDVRVVIKHGSFTSIAHYAEELGWVDKVSGVLFDLGVSSPQLDHAERGFSFQKNGPLDMRMNQTASIPTAAEWINKATAEEIADVLYHYGQEKYSRRLAKVIVDERKKSPILTTEALSNLIQATLPKSKEHKHPATRSFQAIRIFINQELRSLEQALEQCLSVLKTGGRIVVITFHSLEEIVVKKFMQRYTSGNESLAFQYMQKAPSLPRLKRLGKAVTPSSEEIRNNLRARSARLRILEKVY